MFHYVDSVSAYLDARDQLPPGAVVAFAIPRRGLHATRPRELHANIPRPVDAPAALPRCACGGILVLFIKGYATCSACERGQRVAG